MRRGPALKYSTGHYIRDVKRLKNWTVGTCILCSKQKIRSKDWHKHYHKEASPFKKQEKALQIEEMKGFIKDYLDEDNEEFAQIMDEVSQMAESHLEGSQVDEIVKTADHFISQLNEKIHSKIIKYIGNNLGHWEEEKEQLLQRCEQFFDSLFQTVPAALINRYIGTIQEEEEEEEEEKEKQKEEKEVIKPAIKKVHQAKKIKKSKNQKDNIDSKKKSAQSELDRLIMKAKQMSEVYMLELQMIKPNSYSQAIQWMTSIATHLFEINEHYCENFHGIISSWGTETLNSPDYSKIRRANIIQMFAYISLVVKLDRQLPVILVLEALSKGKVTKSQVIAAEALVLDRINYKFLI